MFLANYTYSKAMDEISDVFTIKSTGTGITDPLNPQYDYGPADFDTRHVGTFTVNYTIPYKKKNLLLGDGVSRRSCRYRVVCRFPRTIPTAPMIRTRMGARWIGRCTWEAGYRSAVHRKGNPYFNAMLSLTDFAPYTCPANVNQGLWCDPPMSRNAFYGPHYTDLDAAVSKRFYVGEFQHFTVQASFFNVFNHPNLSNPVSDINNASQFGKPQATGDPRVTQLSLRYDF